MFLLTSKKFRIGILAGLVFLAAGLGFSVQALHDDEGHPHGGGPNGQPNGQPLVAMGKTPCIGGMAGTFPCHNVDLASFLPLKDIGGGTVNDLWGWTDPLTGKEYAIVGRSSGTSFVDLSNPEQPIYLGNLPTHSVDSLWRGIKVYANHAFIVSEADNHGMQVFDLTRLRGVASPPITFTENAHYAGFRRAHTLAINEATGFAYAAGSKDTCSGGLHMVDIRNPIAPVFAGCVNQDGYTHETQCVTYRGPDTLYKGHEICFSANEDTLTIVDVTNKSAPPVQLSRTTYLGVQYAHQGWLTEDHKHFLLDDELDEQKSGVNSTTFIWDVADLNAPSVKGKYTGQSTAIDHNLYIRGNRAYQSNYRSGLRILDITNISSASLSELAFFDIYPLDDAPEFNGAWSNYPFFLRDIVIVGGIEQGLFVLRPTHTPAPLQLMLDESGPGANQAVALDSILFLRDPFPIVNAANLLFKGTDHNTRVVVFVNNLQLAQGETPSSSSVIVSLISSNNQPYNVTAEKVRLVPAFSFAQVVFRLPDNLSPGTYTLKVKAHGQESNSGTIRIKS
ncbi:MAG TPA: choice-of-anchor B family protein [Pyrinomonadaceae bacterium]|jgi:choice-of-anchor B domain-containing protein